MFSASSLGRSLPGERIKLPVKLGPPFRENETKRFYRWAVGRIRKTVGGGPRILKPKLQIDFSPRSNIVDRRLSDASPEGELIQRYGSRIRVSGTECLLNRGIL